MEVLERISIREWAGPFPAGVSEQAELALEGGRVLYAPDLRFAISHSEQRFLSPSFLTGKSKNISFDPQTRQLSGTACEGAEREGLTAMISRFSSQAVALMRSLCPTYGDQLVPRLTSFRPAEIQGRVSSWRKDDTRLHVDAFPSRPNQGKRILRVFANVNPSQARVWRVGEPFQQAATKLLPRVKPPLPGSLGALSLLGITKGQRTLYDHYMLGLHDAMKADADYQTKAPQERVSFPAGTVWACFTDLVSHGAMAGQHTLEQTFQIPVGAMRNPKLAPLSVLEDLLKKPLV